MTKSAALELTCYLHPAWHPLIRPAGVKRDWMEAAPEAFPHRCLPLNIANAHGWEIATPCAVEASWNGGSLPSDVTIRVPDGTDPATAPVAIFGQGILTFHIMGLFRTSPGWNLWIGGPPNGSKDGISPLNGIVETDWSPFTFTMNWHLTRANHPVQFIANETIALIFPIQRGALEQFEPKFAALEDAPELAHQFSAWSAARDAFHARMAASQPANPADKWQKHYYRGVDVEDCAYVLDHQAKLRVKPFTGGPAAPPPQSTQLLCPVTANPAIADAQRRIAELEKLLAKRDWLLDTIEGQRVASPAASAIPRRQGIARQLFQDEYYAGSRPVIVGGMLAHWPALGWTPEILKAKVGDAEVEYQARRNGDPDYEQNMAGRVTRGPFTRFIDDVTAPGAGNNVYMTAYNAARNVAPLAPLAADLGTLDALLKPTGAALDGMPWIGAAGSFTPLHQDLTNNLIVQLVGRKRLRLAPPSETSRLYNEYHVYSGIRDVDGPQLDTSRFPRLVGSRIYDVILEPGELLFVPVGWWHQVLALDFSVTLAYTNFHWPNSMAATYPS